MTTKAVTAWAWVLYWLGLVFAVINLVLFDDSPYRTERLWAAVVVAIVFWGGALMALVLQLMALVLRRSPQ